MVHLTNSDGSLIIAVKLKAKCRFVSASMLTLYILQKLLSTQHNIHGPRRSITLQNCRTLRPVVISISHCHVGIIDGRELKEMYEHVVASMAYFVLLKSVSSLSGYIEDDGHMCVADESRKIVLRSL